MFNLSKTLKRIVSVSAAAVCLITGVHFTPDSEKVTADAASGMDAFEITQDMKIGWNLGNSLDATGGYGYTGLRTETSWGNPKTTKVMIDTVKAKGFNTVRIPTTWYPHLDGNNNIDSEWMARVHEIVDYAVSNDMYVILNVHHEEWVNVDQFTDATYAEAEKKLSAIWQQVSDEFADYDQHLVFEGMNEPRQLNNSNVQQWGNGSGDNGYTWNYINKLNNVFINTVRGQGSAENKERLLMIPGYCASSDLTAVRNISVPENSGNIALSVHAYAPYFFTMATDDKANHNYPGKSGWGEDYSYALNTLFSGLKQISDEKNTPIVIGEFSSSNFDNTDSRVAWAKDYITLAKKAGFPCMLWDNNVEIETNPTGEAHGYLNRTAGGTTWYSESEKVVDMLISTVNDPTILWAGKENVVKTTTSTTTVTTSVTETSATSVTTTTVTSSSTQTTVTTQAGGSKVVEAELTKLDNGVSFKLNGADAVEVTISANSNGGGNGAFDCNDLSGEYNQFGAFIFDMNSGTYTFRQSMEGIEAQNDTVSVHIWWNNNDAVITKVNLIYNDPQTTDPTTTTVSTTGSNEYVFKDVAVYPTKSVYSTGENLDLSGVCVNYYIYSGNFMIDNAVLSDPENPAKLTLSPEQAAITDENGTVYSGDKLAELPEGKYTVSVDLDYDASDREPYGIIKGVKFSYEIVVSNSSDETLYGDANFDGKVDLSDAVMILQSISNPDKYGINGYDETHITLQGMKNGDCAGNGDGLTTKDALAVQMFITKIVTSLPIE